MSRSLPLCLLLLMTTTAHTQWTDDPQVNTTVRDGAGVDAATPLMSDGPGGSIYVSWFDNSLGGYELRMQRIDASGYPMWAPDGLVVSDHPQNSALFRYDLTTDNVGNAIVAFQDERTGDLRPVVYKLNPSGDMLWGADGIELADGLGGTGLAPAIGVLANNDVIVAWNGDNGTSSYIPFKTISAAGVLAPGVGMINGAEDWTRPRIIGTSDGGFFIQCVRQTGNFPYTNTLFANRYDASGAQQFQTQFSTRTISFFYFPEPIPDGHDGFYMVFNTGNPMSAALTDVYVQRMRADGSLWNSEGSEMMTGTATQRYSGGLALVSDDDGLLVPIKVTNIAQSAGGINVQRVDTSGAALLGIDAVQIIAQTTELPEPFGAAATPDGAILSYSAGGFGTEHISATRVDLAGTTLWTPAHAQLCTLNSNKDDAASSALVNDQLVVVWQDDRVGSGIYAQAITADGDLLLTSDVPVATSEPTRRIQVLQDTDGAWLLVNGGTGNAVLRVLDAAGRLVRTENVVLSGGVQRFQLTATTAGMHVVELATSIGVDRVKWLAP